MKRSKTCVQVLSLCWILSFWMAQASLAQTACSNLTPAPLSGSTGAQGTLDSTTWPVGAVQARIAMDTGLVTFLDANVATVGTQQLPGTAVNTPVPGGVLNFLNVHLTSGATVTFTAGFSGLPPAVTLLSCQDVVLDAGSSMGATAALVRGSQPGGFLGGPGSFSLAGGAGFGPRSGSLPAPGSLYPAVGGGGGNGGATNLDVSIPSGGGGGPAFVIIATQRVTLNGTIGATGLNASLSQIVAAQGGGGGAVRIEGLLVEGTGVIDTSGGLDAAFSVRSPAGPVEVQAFLQDLFTGSATTSPIRGNAPMLPAPTNLPTILITQLNTTTNFGNTGSLTLPDTTLPVPTSSQVPVTVTMQTQGVPDGTVLAVRAVSTFGNASNATAAVSQNIATAQLTLNANSTYQIVATPTIAFAVARTLPEANVSGLREIERNLRPPEKNAQEPAAVVASQWMKAFGVSPEMAEKAAKRASEATPRKIAAYQTATELLPR